MNESKPFVPAKRGVVVALLCAATAVILVFVAVLRHDLRDVKTLDAGAYTVAVPAGFVYECDVTDTGGVYALRGWACVDGERITSVDCFVVLYDTRSGEYLRLPTTMERNEAAGVRLGHENYAYGGFTSFAIKDQLESPAERYELCFAYRNNDHNELVHTGRPLAEG